VYLLCFSPSKSQPYNLRPTANVPHDV
jgi:hypothetical protein